jgi:putative transposase
VSRHWTERTRFVTDWEGDLYAMVELCARYGVSRKTSYKWVDHYEREGPDGLSEPSRAPHHCPPRIADNIAAAICAGPRQHPSWGPEKKAREQRTEMLQQSPGREAGLATEEPALTITLTGRPVS